MSKQHIYNLKFSLKTLEANCHRPSCKVHAFIKIQNQERKFKQIADMKKNVAVFNSDLDWQLVGVPFQEISGSYTTKNAILSIMYETSQPGSRTNKLKIGHVTVDLATILNSKTYRIHNYYPLQKCYDQAAKIKLAIDLTKIDEAAIRGGQFLGTDQYSRLKHTMQWRTSKIKQRIVDQQKNLLQNKLYQYQDKLQKYRDSHNQQLKRISEQLQRKQDKITTLAQQNNSLMTALQSLQITSEKQKTYITSLQQQHHQIKQTQHVTSLNKDSIQQQLITARSETTELKYKLQTMQKARQKKQQYYKSQLQKYNKKYLDTQNVRNRIVFEMQAKLKQQLQNKDSHYKQVIQKMDGKYLVLVAQMKDMQGKFHKDLGIVKQNLEKSQKDKHQVKIYNQQMKVEIQMLLANKKQLDGKVEEIQGKIRNLTSENQVSQFSNNNLQKQNTRLRSQSKQHSHQHTSLKYQLQLANRTIQQNQQTLVKLHRQLKVHKQRQYYIQQKYQDQLEIKTYNQQHMLNTNSSYYQEIRKLKLQVKLYQQRIDEDQEIIVTMKRQKQRLQDEIKRYSQRQFQIKEDKIHLELQIKSLKSQIEQFQANKYSLELELASVKKLYDSISMKYGALQHQYEQEIGNKQDKIYMLEERIREQRDDYDYTLTSDMQSKNILLSSLQLELTKQKQQNKKLHNQLHLKSSQFQQIDLSNRSLLDKQRITERQTIRLKSQLQRLKQIEQKSIKQSQKSIKQYNKLKQQLQTNKKHKQTTQKKINKIRQAYTQIIKWVLDRLATITIYSSYNTNTTSTFTTNRQYIQSIDGQVEMQMIHFVNNGLQKIYNQWDKLNKKLLQTSQEKDKYVQQISKLKLQIQYKGINNNNNNTYAYVGYNNNNNNNNDNTFQEQIQAITMKLNNNNNINNKNNNNIANRRNQYLIKNDSQETFRETFKYQQIKRQNRQLHNQVTQKNYQIQTLKQDLQNQKNSVNQFKEDIRDLNQQIQQLKNSLSKKNAQLNTYQYQSINSNNDKFDQFSLNSNTYHSRNNNNRGRQIQSSFKSDVQSKYRDRKALEESQLKYQEIQRERTLQRARIQLLESKGKNSSEHIAHLQEQITKLLQNLKETQSNSKKYQKSYENQKSSSDNLTKQYQLLTIRYTKKQKQLSTIQNQLTKSQKSVDILSAKIQQTSAKTLQKLKQRQHQCSSLKQKLISIQDQAAQCRTQIETLTMQLQSFKQQSLIDKKQYEARVHNLEEFNNKYKKQNQESYQKYIVILTEKSQLQEKIKDFQMEQKMTQQNYRKIVGNLEEKLETKEYQFQEFKFTSESNMIQLQRELDENHK